MRPQPQRSRLSTGELAPFRLTSPLTEFQPLAALRGSPFGRILGFLDYGFASARNDSLCALCCCLKKNIF